MLEFSKDFSWVVMGRNSLEIMMLKGVMLSWGSYTMELKKIYMNIENFLALLSTDQMDMTAVAFLVY